MIRGGSKPFSRVRALQELLPKLSIVNVVATADLKQKVDIVKIGQHPWGTHSPTKYGGRVAYVKSLRMKGKVTVFPSGKLISVGTRSETEARQSITTTCRLLEKTGFIKRARPIIKVQNVVALAKLPVGIDLEHIARRMSHIIYEPEQFPAAIFRSVKHPEVTALVFSSGKLIIAGAKSVSSVKLISEDIGKDLTASTRMS